MLLRVLKTAVPALAGKMPTAAAEPPEAEEEEEEAELEGVVSVSKAFTEARAVVVMSALPLPPAVSLAEARVIAARVFAVDVRVASSIAMVPLAALLVLLLLAACNRFPSVFARLEETPSRSAVVPAACEKVPPPEEEAAPVPPLELPMLLLLLIALPMPFSTVSAPMGLLVRSSGVRAVRVCESVAASPAGDTDSTAPVGDSATPPSLS